MILGDARKAVRATSIDTEGTLAEFCHPKDMVVLMTLSMSLFEAIKTRRDVRREFSGEQVAPEVLRQILDAGHRAPSVGNTQPWDFVVVRDPRVHRTFADHVAGCRADFAASLPAERAASFDPIVVEGIVSSGCAVVVTHDGRRGGEHVLGRHTVDETGLFSTILAIENMWLAATALGIGIGWVSFYHEEFLSELVCCPDGVRPVAWLCVGPVTHLQEDPDLERARWRKRRPLDDAIHSETFGAVSGA